MAQSQFSLMWDTHKNNICNGLSALQQNGEFVDMTLAADGHLVKVHQIIIALASPYLKDLISTAQCPHPVIFLNKISYTTLSTILEYIYTGEVMVSIENLNELIEAGKELHIKGLEDMKIQEPVTRPQQKKVVINTQPQSNNDSLDDEVEYFQIEDTGDPTQLQILEQDQEMEPESILSTTENNCEDDYMDDKAMVLAALPKSVKDKIDNSIMSDCSQVNVVQYTVSNQGSLQMILNRYVYYLKHSNRANTRQWRCVDYLNSNKCPAYVFTENDVVIKRIASHVHPFHDKRILKKVREGAVFSAISEAQANSKKCARKNMEISLDRE